MGKKGKRLRNAKTKNVKNGVKKVKGEGRRGRYFNLFDSKYENERKAYDGTGNSHEENTNKKKSLPQVVLDIPLVVIAQVVSNIKEIETLAEREDIPLITAQSFQEKTPNKAKSKESPPSGWMLGGLSCLPVKILDFIPIQTKHKKNTKYQKTDFQIKPQSMPVELELKPTPMESGDFISFKSDTLGKSSQPDRLLAKPEPMECPDFSSFKSDTLPPKPEPMECPDFISFKSDTLLPKPEPMECPNLISFKSDTLGKRSQPDTLLPKPEPMECPDFISFKSDTLGKRSQPDTLLPKPEPMECPNFISFKSETLGKRSQPDTLPPKLEPMECPDFISFKTDINPIKKIEKIKESTNKPSPSTSRYTSTIANFTKLKGDQFVKSLPKMVLPKTENNENKTDFISMDTKVPEEVKCLPKRILRGGEQYKYGYQDIITETFDEKLDEDLAKNVSIWAKTVGNDCLSVALHEEFQDMLTRPQFKKMMGFRERLPTFKRSANLLDIINNNQVVVISGETGCGKSTQVPQIILDNALSQNQGAYINILVTQPRRIAASSLASRVARERAEELGNSVGYAVRLEKSDCRPRGSIKYVTTGILLADLEVNQGLTNFSHVILDEVHERDSHLDLSMCMLKQILKKRRDLKLILMSATMDSRRLCKYFGKCPFIHIKGLSYPVKDFYMENVLNITGYRLPPIENIHYDKDGTENHKLGLTEEEKDLKYKTEIDPWLQSFNGRFDNDVYTTLQDRRIEKLNIDLIMALLVHISQGPPGAVLVFLPGISDILKLLRIMNESEMFPTSNYYIYPLHSKLPTIDQHKIFKRPPKHIRKIIVATNIAETSITIDDIVYVVDCGRVKLKGMDVERNISTLKTEFESKANLIQRRGRAGRCQPGIAYHLMTSYRSQNIPEHLLPELQRSSLLEPVLQIKKLRLGKALEALALVPDPPADITVENAVRHLQILGALDDEERLTPLGWHLARLPVHPAAGKLLLFGALFGCVDRAASVAAVWGFKDPFNLVMGKEQEVNLAKRKLSLGEPSDHVAVSEAVIQWELRSELGTLDPDNQTLFAQQHFLSENTLKLLSQMKRQLCDSLRQMGFLASKNVRVSWENRNKDNLCVFKAIVAAALYPNIAVVRWANLQNPDKQTRLNVLTPEDGKIQLHPTSMMFVPRGPKIPLCNKPGANWLVYWMKQKSTDLFLFEVTLVFTLPLLLFGELIVSEVEHSPEECYLSASTVKVRCLKGTADVIFRLRTLLDQVLASMVRETSDRSTRYSEFDNLVFKAVIDLMTLEDERPEGLVDEFSDSDNSDCEIVCDMKPEERYPVIVID